MGKKTLVLVSGAVLLLLVALVRLSDPSAVQQVRLAYFDYLQRLMPREAADLPVRVVDIDEASLADLGQWPWPRHVLAQLVDNLAAAGAVAIVFDVIFAEPDRLSLANMTRDPALSQWLEQSGISSGLNLPDNDLLFAEAMQGRNVVLGVADIRQGGAAGYRLKSGAVEIGLAPASALPRANALTGLVPMLAEASAGIGSISTNPHERFGVVRAVPVMWRSEIGLLPALSVEALRVALGQSTFILTGSGTTEGIVEGLRIGAFDVPTTSDGLFTVHFRPDDPTLYVSAHQVLAAAPDLIPLLEGHIVLVGTSAAGLLDIRTTPLGESVPGVSIHAQIIEQILLGDFLYRSDLTIGAEFLSFFVLGGVVLAVIANFGPIPSLASGLTGAGLTTATSWLAFRDYGIQFDATFPMLGGLVLFGSVFALQYIVADREKRIIRRSFAQYVSPEILADIESKGYDLKLGGVEQDIAVMFADIRNFTPLSETMQPTELVALLNELFTDLGSNILQNQGTIDKFIGDALMAFWNAPIPTEGYQRKACMAAIGMRAAISALNIRKGLVPDSPIAMAIGLSSGLACVGNIGSRDRFNYSAIGDTVNRAARVETSCRHIGCDLLVSDDIVTGAGDLAFLMAGRIALKGQSGRAAVHVLVGDATLAKSPEFIALAESHVELLDQLSRPEAECAAILAQCQRRAARVDTKLGEFYDRISQRREDFQRIL